MLTRDETKAYRDTVEFLKQHGDEMLEQAAAGNKAAKEFVRVLKYWAGDRNDTSQQRRLMRSVQAYRAARVERLESAGATAVPAG
jgi:hypothetical protein